METAELWANKAGVPAKLRSVPLILLPPRLHSTAVATGNNAAWHCYCENAPLLIGRTGGRIVTSEGYQVECPECKARYAVHPSKKDKGPADRVLELA